MYKQIWDRLRKKYVVATHEEIVRQNIINYLINVKHYPLSLFRIEKRIFADKHRVIKSIRPDIVIYNNLLRPFMLVECKATNVKLNSKAIDQAMMYNTQLRAKYVLLTNAKQTICFRNDDNKYTISTIPTYDKIQ